MAGIDNNTVLYLRGDTFNDLSSNDTSITNNGFTIVESDIFSKCFYTNNTTDDHTNKLNISELNLDFNSDFSIDFMIMPKGANAGNRAILSSNANASVWTNNSNAWLLLLKNNKISLTNTATNTDDIISSSTTLEIDKFYHVELSRFKDVFYIFINGRLEVSTNVGSYMFSNYNFAFGVSDLRGWGANCAINNIRISQFKGHTEDFTPPTRPYSSIDINVTNQDNNKIDFNISKLGQEVINKVEVLVNGVVSKTYASIGDLTYNIDDNLCYIGDNDIVIRVAYDDNYVEEEVLIYTYSVDNLPTTSSLKNIIDRYEVFNNDMEFKKNKLKDMLISKNLEISEDENKLSDLIPRVSELGEIVPPLYLYNEGDECIDTTGGWKGALTYSTAYWAGGQSIGTFNDSYVNLKTSATRSIRRICTSNKIDVSNYNTLYIELTPKTNTSTYGVIQLLLYTSLSEQSSNWVVANVKASATGVKGVYSLNLSNVNSSYYIGVIATVDYSGSVEADIYKIWLEK